jgi:hypothetical protein
MLAGVWLVGFDVFSARVLTRVFCSGCPNFPLPEEAFILCVSEFAKEGSFLLFRASTLKAATATRAASSRFFGSLSVTCCPAFPINPAINVDNRIHLAR